MIKKKTLVLLLFIIILGGCNPAEPPVSSSIGLSVELVSSTEAWLKVNAEGESGDIIITSNEKEIKSFTAPKNDTVVYIDSLLPNKNYTLQALVAQNGKIIGKSEKVTSATLDTTSHNFTWNTFTFGDGGSSVINDVAIVNDTLAYAGGEIYINDSTGQPDQKPYNFAKWNGEKWNFLRIQFYTVHGDSHHTPYPTSSIIAFNTSNTWVAMNGDQIAQWNGDKQTAIMITPISFSITKLWGKDTNSIYAVGDGGVIEYFQNNSWQKIESGTNTIITDIWGIVNNNNEVTAYCPVSSFFTPGDKKILRIKNNKVDSVSWSVQRLLYSVWTNNEQFLYVCGSGTYENKKGYWEEIKLPLVSMNSIRGNDLNDIFVAGDFGLVAHFNGSTWKVYNDVFAADYYSISLKGNLIMLAGQQNGKGVITIGRRN